MKITFYGSSLLSSYWNGAATYYRGILKALAAFGHDITFYEPDAFDRQSHRDIAPPDWCQVVVYPATSDGLRAAAAHAGDADIVVKASGVGYKDDVLLDLVLTNARRDALKIWWDVDAPATIAEICSHADHPLRSALGEIDLVLTYGGGPDIFDAYRHMGAILCHPIYNALDPDTHHPVAPDQRFSSHLGLLANRLPDREQRIEDFFFHTARRLPDFQFLLGGSGWSDREIEPNIRAIGHVPTGDHNAFNATPRAILNINRASMAKSGFSPPTRIFEAAGVGACIITDSWPGLDLFLKPGCEVLVVRDGNDLVDLMEGLDEKRAHEIGANGRLRVLRTHTYAQRAHEVDDLLVRAFRAKTNGAAA